MKDISLIISIRPNSDQFIPLIENILETANDLDKIEICVAYSPLEEDNLQFLNDRDDIIKGIKVDMKLGGSYLYHYINKAAAISNGKLIWVIMDDMRIWTKDFDLKLKPYLKLYNQIYRIKFGGSHGTDIHPIITRKWIQTTGQYATGITPLVWITRLGDLLPPENTKTAVDLVVMDEAELGKIPLRRTTIGLDQPAIKDFREEELTKFRWYEAQLEKEAKLLREVIKNGKG